MFSTDEKKYFIWTKHYDDLKKCDAAIVKQMSEFEYSIIVHPAHEPVFINITTNILEQIKQLEKSTQLYFFGLVWANFIDINKHLELLKQVLVEICSVQKPALNRLKKDMLWDDHAISERVSFIVTLLQSRLVNSFSNQQIKVMEENIEIANSMIEEFIISDNWSNNNHRVFHLCGRLAFAKYRQDESGISNYLNLLSETLGKLFQYESGLTVEQAISYYSFDLILLKKTFDYLDLINLSIEGLNYRDIFIRNRKSLSFLAFPDGHLPASGDTPLGFKTKLEKISETDESLLRTHLKELGHFKLTNSNKTLALHLITHNEESAHGHSSPLHIDLWADSVNYFLVDSGGPYLYGNKLRYEWFRHTKAHNCLLVEGAEIACSQTKADYQHGNTLIGTVINAQFKHNREVVVSDVSIKVKDSIKSEFDWSLSYHFAAGELRQTNSNHFVFTRGSHSILMEINSDIEAAIQESYRTYGRGDKMMAPTLLISGAPSSVIECTFTKVVKAST